MDKDFIEKITKYYGYSYIIPCVCSFGIVCNLINLSVLASRRLKESPYTYLTSLAWFDLLTLLFTLTTTFTRGAWASTSPTTEFYLKKLERLFFLPSANLFSALSIAVTVVLTIERYLFIKFPMHASSFCTSSNAKRIVAVLIALVFLFRLPMYFFSDAVKSYSRYNLSSNTTNSTTIIVIENFKFTVEIVKKYEQFHKLYFFLSFLLFEIVPFILLFAFNLNLVLLIKSSTKELESFEKEKQRTDSNDRPRQPRRFLVADRRRSISNEQSSQLVTVAVTDDGKSTTTTSVYNNLNSSPQGNGRKMATLINLKNKTIMDSKIEKRKRDQYKLTRTLISVVFFVLLSEISSISTYDSITEFLVGRRFKDYMTTYYKLQVFISNLIVLVVHSVNFFLYCAFNRKYLTIFKQKYSFLFNLLGKLKCKKSVNEAYVI